MQALLFQNARAVAALWAGFVERLRRHWDSGRQLPHMCRTSDPQLPTWGTCLLHQHMQLLDYCITHTGGYGLLLCNT